VGVDRAIHLTAQILIAFLPIWGYKRHGPRGCRVWWGGEATMANDLRPVI
jgi:hypothetical protein